MAVLGKADPQALLEAPCLTGRPCAVPQANWRTPFWVDLCQEAGTALRRLRRDQVTCRPLPVRVPLAGMEAVRCGRRLILACSHRSILPGLAECLARRVCPRVSASGMDDAAKATVKEIVKHLGGKYTLHLTRQNTHLVLEHATGAKFDAAPAYGVHPVTPEWLLASADAGARHGCSTGSLRPLAPGRFSCLKPCAQEGSCQRPSSSLRRRLAVPGPGASRSGLPQRRRRRRAWGRRSCRRAGRLAALPRSCRAAGQPMAQARRLRQTRVRRSSACPWPRSGQHGRRASARAVPKSGRPSPQSVCAAGALPGRTHCVLALMHAGGAQAHDQSLRRHGLQPGALNSSAERRGAAAAAPAEHAGEDDERGQGLQPHAASRKRIVFPVDIRSASGPIRCMAALVDTRSSALRRRAGGVIPGARQPERTRRRARQPAGWLGWEGRIRALAGEHQAAAVSLVLLECLRPCLLVSRHLCLDSASSAPVGELARAASFVDAVRRAVRRVWPPGRLQSLRWAASFARMCPPHSCLRSSTRWRCRSLTVRGRLCMLEISQSGRVPGIEPRPRQCQWGRPARAPLPRPHPLATPGWLRAPTSGSAAPRAAAPQAGSTQARRRSLPPSARASGRAAAAAALAAAIALVAMPRKGCLTARSRCVAASGLASLLQGALKVGDPLPLSCEGVCGPGVISVYFAPGRTCPAVIHAVQRERACLWLAGWLRCRRPGGRRAWPATAGRRCPRRRHSCCPWRRHSRRRCGCQRCQGAAGSRRHGRLYERCSASR